MPAGENPKRIQVFYDGQCPMCTALMDSVDHSSKKEVFDLRDMHADSPLPFQKDAVEKDIHVIGLDGQTHKGADAILVIVAQYPRLKALASFGKLFFVKPFLPIGYRLVSSNRRFLFGPASRIFWLKVAVLVAFVIGLFLSANLWLSSRSYPVTPIIDGLPTISHPWDWLLFGGMILTALTAIIFPRPQKLIWGFVAILLVLCALDQTRWQPWVFQYGFLLIALAFFSWNSEDEAGRVRTMNIARLVVAGTYIFSGLQKVNFGFMDSVFPWFVGPITHIFPQLASPLHVFGMAAPFLQVAFGVGLLTKRFRRPSVVLAISMHVFILAMLGPFGLNWNSVVWPWTTAMLIFDLLLFAGREDFSFRNVLWTKGYPLHAVALVLFGILPFFSFFNLWDSFLSSAIYSGNVTVAYVYTSDAGLSRFPPSLSRLFKPVSDNTNAINVQHWALEEMNVRPYPETRVYKNIGKQLCDYDIDPPQMTVVIEEKRVFRNNPQITFRCSEL